MNRATIKIISPMRMLRAWLRRERTVRGPGAIELDVVEHQVDREQTAVTAAAGEASRLEHRLDRLRAEMAADLDDGVIDAREARLLARHLNNTSRAAHGHTESLEALT